MQPLHKIFYLSSILVFSLIGHAQNEFSKWYFGAGAGLNFLTQPPTILTNGALTTFEGVASISDSGGNILFYTAGQNVYNSAHTLMANGSGLLGHVSTTQSAIIVKQPENNNLYYIFTATSIGFPDGLRYSIVDMSLAAGMGSVTVKNAPLYTPTCEKQVAVRHCNGRDVWIVSHQYGTNEFKSFLLTNTGVSANPVISALGETPDGGTNGGGPAAGQMKISPNGRKLATATAVGSMPNTLGNGGFHLFDFDPATGVVSNSLTLLGGQFVPSYAGSYAVEFSPDGTKLYGATSAFAYLISTLYQWDICAPTNLAIISSEYSVGITGVETGSLQRAIDGKIYLAINNTPTLSVINNPNASGAAMNFIFNGLNLSPKLSTYGLPNYVNLWSKIQPPLFTNTINCQSVSFAVPPVISFSSGCTSISYPPNYYLWNFGDPSSGAANISTLANPTHSFSIAGTYTVSLILYSNCTNDTIYKEITVNGPGPILNIIGDFFICKGAKATYTATGGSSYLWSNYTTSSVATFSPASSTIYAVTATLNGCSSTKSFTVYVNPCTDISEISGNLPLQIYPNPIKDVLTIEAERPAQLLIFDMNGALVLESTIRVGHNELTTKGLKPGIYIFQANDEKGVWRMRLIKIE